MPKSFKAYTLLEVIVVIGIIVLITGMVVPISIRQTKLNELSVAAKDFHSHVFVQQQNAFSGKNNSVHGIYVENEGYWLFQGETFATSASKDYFSFGKGIRLISGNTEIVFPRGSQKPLNEASIVLTLANNNYIILISAQGVINSYVQN
jgi:type II secretory pathway pseudopilin PulG